MLIPEEPGYFNRLSNLDNAIQRISVDKTNHAIHWIVIYPVDSFIHFLNNRGQIFKWYDNSDGGWGMGG